MIKIAGVFLLLLSVLNGFSQKLNTSLTYSVNRAMTKTGRPPVIFILHGYGADENDFLSLSQNLDNRFTTFLLRAPFKLDGAGYCWYALQRLPNGDFKYDYEQVKQSRAKVLAFISEACKAYQLDSTQVYLMGFSQGAILSYELALFAPSKIKGVLALSGRMMTESKTHNNSASVTGINFFIAHGTSDDKINFSEAEKAQAFLQEKKIRNLVFKKYPVGHTLCEAEINDIKAFLEGAVKH